MTKRIPGEETDRFFCSNCGFPCKKGRDAEGSYGESGWNFSSGSNASSASDQITNGAFTANTNSWTGVDCTLSSAAGGQSGNCLTITTTGGSLQYAYQALTGLEFGVMYRLVAYVKSGTSGDEAFELCLMGPDRDRTMYSKSGTSNSTWTAHNLLWRAFHGNNVVSLVKNTSTSGTILFDTVSVYEYAYSVSESLTGCPYCGSRAWRK